jgi:hypothetical protein
MSSRGGKKKGMSASDKKKLEAIAARLKAIKQELKGLDKPITVAAAKKKKPATPKQRQVAASSPPDDGPYIMSRVKDLRSGKVKREEDVVKKRAEIALRLLENETTYTHTKSGLSIAELRKPATTDAQETKMAETIASTFSQDIELLLKDFNSTSYDDTKLPLLFALFKQLSVPSVLSVVLNRISSQTRTKFERLFSEASWGDPDGFGPHDIMYAPEMLGFIADAKWSRKKRWAALVKKRYGV